MARRVLALVEQLHKPRQCAWRMQSKYCRHADMSSRHCAWFRFLRGFSSPAPSTLNAYAYAWTETPYLEYIVGLEPEGSTPATSTGGATLSGVRGDLRPHPGYTARLIRLRIENGSSVKAREAILEEKSYMRDFGRFWIPMVADLMGGPHHHFSLEIFTWIKDHPTVLKSARRMEVERLYSMMISYAGVVGKVKLARSWFDDMEDKGFRKSSQCCNALIIAYASNGDVDSALAILSGMRQYHTECPPNAMTFYILISMYARRHEWQQMEEALGACREAGFGLDAITCTTLVWAYAKMGRPDLVDKALNESKQLQQQEQLQLQQQHYGTLLVAYSQLNAVDKVEETLRRVEESASLKSVPVVVIEEVAKAYWRNRLVERLEKLVAAVEEPSSALQSYLVDAYAREGRLDEVEDFLSKLCENRGAFVEAAALELVIAAFARAAQLDRLCTGIYSRAKDAGFALSPSTHELLVVELAKAGCYHWMDRVAEDMPGGADSCSQQLLQVLCQAYDKSGQRPVKLDSLKQRLQQLDDDSAPALASVS